MVVGEPLVEPHPNALENRSNAMIDRQIDEEMILRDEVSDEELEAAVLVALGGFPTLPHTYCFACPSGVPRHRHQPISVISSSPKAIHSAVPIPYSCESI